MTRMALCDDEAGQREAVGALLRAYVAARPSLAVKLSFFSCGRDLLAAAEDCGGFDIYVLDMVMPDLGGIELGVRLRELGCDGAIIYLTVSPEYAVASYAARAFYYLMKPAEPDKLFQVLDQAMAELEKKRAACVAVRTRDGVERVRLDEVVYAELAGRTVRYHLADGSSLESVTVRGPFQAAAAPLLADRRFFLCGASFVANLFYVAAVEKGALRMDGGARVPLARGRAAQAKRRWSDYWLDAPGGEAP